MLVCGNCWAHLAGIVQAIVGVLFHAAAEYDGGQAQRRFLNDAVQHTVGVIGSWSVPLE